MPLLNHMLWRNLISLVSIRRREETVADSAAPLRRPLHIVFLDFDDIKNHLLAGGQARATFEVARRLIKLGHRVTVVCSRFPGSEDGFNEGIYYRHVGLGTTSVRLNNVAFFFALPLAVRTLRADAIIECFTAPISTCFSPLFTSIPVIGMPTMFEAKEFAQKYHLPFHWVEWLGCKFYRYFLAYSSLNKMKMEKLNPRVITRIIPNGVGEELFEASNQEGSYAFFIGRIDIRQKGLDLLLEAIRLKRNELQHKIIIAGNGPKEEEAELQRLIREKNLSDSVEFIGRVDGEKKMKLLAGCAFGVYPSRFEDFPLVPLEFTGLGKPLVCYDIPGLAWVDSTVAAKAQPFSAESLAQAISALSNDAPMREKMRRKCRPFAEKYGWNNIAKDYARFCYEVLELERGRKNKQCKAKVKVLVLGGAGYIGDMLCRYLHDQGDEVIIMDNLLYETEARSFQPFALIRGDIRNRDDVAKAITQADVIVNLAALSNDPASDLDPELTWEVNYKANEAIAEICRKQGKRVVYASSCSVYGFAETGVFNEDSPLNPVTLYARTKMLSEKLYLANGSDAVVLRFSTVYGYGPKSRFDLVVNMMIGHSHFQNKITVHGGNQWRPLVHVKDVCRAIYVALHKRDPKNRVYNVGSKEQNYQISRLAHEIGKEYPNAEIIEETNTIDGRSYKVDFTRFEEDFGFQTLYTIQDAAREFAEAFKTNKIRDMEEDIYYRVRYLKNNRILSRLSDYGDSNFFERTVV